MNPLSRLLATLLRPVADRFSSAWLLLASVGGLLAFGVLWVRALWLRRKPFASPASRGPEGQRGEVIDAEYTVVHRRRE
jgi:hypothetical protein